MERYIARFVKPIFLSLICFAAVYYLTQSIGTALVVSLIPLLLGWLGIMESFAYSLAALSFISAVMWAITPIGAKTAVQASADWAVAQVKAEMSKPSLNATETTLK